MAFALVLAISVFLQVSGERNRSLNVLLLTGLVSTREKDDQFAIPFGVINPIARPHIDLQLGDAIGQPAMLARIAVSKPVNAHLNACPSDTVFELVDPISVDLIADNSSDSTNASSYAGCTTAGALLVGPHSISFLPLRGSLYTRG
jgi:hypothetical protein